MGDLDVHNVRVGVLKGGVSQERDISLISGKETAHALRRKGITTVELDVTTAEENEIKKLVTEANIDVAFIALHGAFGEDGTIQHILEQLHIPYTGSGPAASKSAMDKIAAKEKFIAADIPTPNFFVLQKNDSFPHRVPLPTVIKPHHCGSSIGISIVTSRQEVGRALAQAFAITDTVLVEEYIQGQELTVGILEEIPLSVVAITPKEGYYDFATKYTDGLADFQAPAVLPDHIYVKTMNTALGAHQSLGCKHFSRVDIRLSPQGIPFVLEVNTIPGLTTHSLLPLSAKACGLDFDSLMVKMLALAVKDAVNIRPRG